MKKSKILSFFHWIVISNPSSVIVEESLEIGFLIKSVMLKNLRKSYSFSLITPPPQQRSGPASLAELRPSFWNRRSPLTRLPPQAFPFHFLQFRQHKKSFLLVPRTPRPPPHHPHSFRRSSIVSLPHPSNTRQVGHHCGP